MFEHGFQETKEDLQETFNYLTNAIASIDNAFVIYEADDIQNAKEKNYYGMGLSTYTKAHIYRNFASELCRDNEKYSGLYKEDHK